MFAVISVNVVGLLNDLSSNSAQPLVIASKCNVCQECKAIHAIKKDIILSQIIHNIENTTVKCQTM